MVTIISKKPIIYYNYMYIYAQIVHSIVLDTHIIHVCICLQNLMQKIVTSDNIVRNNCAKFKNHSWST